MSDAELAADVVRRAGRAAAGIREAGLSVEQKSDRSDLVTQADREAERIVVDRLREARPEDGVVGEEGASVPGTGSRRWVIDPVDGTYNFVRGLDWWCSALALQDGDDVVLGAVHHPASDAVYVGGPDLPPTRDGVPLEPQPDVALADACVTTYLHPPFYGDEVGAAFERMVNGAATVRMLGSGTMDSVAVAEGRLHVRCQHSVPIWDWLPGAALVLGLGGAARQVSAAGVVWSVLGAPTAVAEVCSALTER
ncbi:inositol monophosphatase family protein [Nocardioides mangrovicus]|uniref:inositol monophosphatase family protein n=1 Tax=Nocardioides mangrovicus TaxID=2478913 RepID=UPI001E5346E7|nr:inositol monophosphatase [Nocardioides mangrovicus]